MEAVGKISLVPQSVRCDALVQLLGRPIGKSMDGHVLVMGEALACRSKGPAGGNRTAVWCFSVTQGDISCATVTAGWAKKWPMYWGSHRCHE